MFNEAQESNIILQGVLLTGIRDIKFDSSVKESSTKLLSNQGIRRKIYGPQKTTCSFSKPYNGQDFIQSLTGVSDLSGQFIYKNNAINFSDAVISDYTLNLDENGFGKVSVTLQIFGDTKPTTNLKLSSAVQDFPILNRTPKMTHFNLDGKSSAVKQINYNASLNPKSSNIIGSINSSNIHFDSPAVHEISADIEISGQEVEDPTGFVDNDKLTKNIDIIFAPEENKANIDAILAIQSLVKSFESSGHKVDDFDFSMGSCAYNAFQFPRASISNQNLNVKAGNTAQITNQYNAYSNTKKITGSTPLPGENISCGDHLKKVQNNFAQLFDRVNNILFTNETDLEASTIGPTGIIDFTVFKNLIDFEFFETQSTGLLNFYRFKNLIDFEGEPLGESDLINLTPIAKDFEDEPLGEFTKEIVGFVKFKNVIDFENLEPGTTQENVTFLGQAPTEDTFESFEPGAQIDLVKITQYTDEQTFEGFTVGGTPPNIVDIDYNPFLNQENFEAIQLGTTGLNKIIPPLANEVTFEDSLVGSTGLDYIITDLDDAIDFELEPEGAVTLASIEIDDFRNETDFELEVTATLPNIQINDFLNQEDFEGEAAGETSTNLYSL